MDRKEARPASRGPIKLDKIPQSTLPKAKAAPGVSLQPDDYDMPQMTIKLSKDEQVFIKDYRRLEDLEREKEIKFFMCVGDPPITGDERDAITDKRVDIKD